MYWEEKITIMSDKSLKVKQAWFIIFRFKFKDHPVASFFIQLLFFLPIPMVFIKLFIQCVPKKVFLDAPFSKKELKKIVGARGILVDVKTKHGDRVLMKSI